MPKGDWVGLWKTPWDIRYSVKYGNNKVTANDGDVCISYITYDYLKKKENPYCFDIGACDCWWAIFCCQHIPSVNIEAFEPGPCSDEFLQTLQTSFPQIRFHNKAVSNKNGILPFSLQEAESHSRSPSSTTVECCVLNSFFDDCPYVDLIKIDTEGHELHILSSLHPYYEKIRAMIVECSVFWYGATEKEAITNTIFIMDSVMKSFPYVYLISRRGVPKLSQIESIQDFLLFLIQSYKDELQYDIFFSKEPFQLETPFVVPAN